MTIRTALAFTLLAAAFVVPPRPLAAQQDDGEQIVVPLSDPSRPALIRVSSVSGSITVKGENRRDVLVIARQRGTARPRPGTTTSSGLRRLTQTGGFTVVEERNEMRIESENPNRTLDFEVRVPARADLRVETVNNSTVIVENVDGDIEAKNVNGSVTLTGVAGSVVAETVNGRLLATMTRVTPQKAMSFISLNGNVDVTLPASTRATLRLRSDMGDVFTDFDLQQGPAAAPRVRDNRRDGGGRYEIEVNRSITGTINGGGPEVEVRTYNGNVYVRKAS